MYQHSDKHLVAVDCIIFGFEKGSLKLLLVKRKIEPCCGEWSLMGGFLFENESLDEAASRILKQLTGLENVYLRQFHAYGEMQRDPAARVISVAYFALIKIREHDYTLVQEYDARWFPFAEKPALIFDHDTMVAAALDRLRLEAKTHPVGFELLPEKFTLPQFQSLYECIYQRKLDNRNFRKSILSTGILEKLDEKDRTGSKKGAWLYRFDKNNYRELLTKGFRFNLTISE